MSSLRKAFFGFATVAAVALASAAALVFPEPSLAAADSSTLDFGVIVPMAFVE